MNLLARNVADNCGRAAKFCPAGLPPLTTPRDSDVSRDSREAATGRGTASPQQQRTRGKSVAEEERPSFLLPPPPPPSPPRVQNLRWGNRAQLAEALANFDGVGPDVVLA